MLNLAYFVIEPTTNGAPEPFGEFDYLTPEQAVEAVAHSAANGSWIEIYVTDGVSEPLIGLCFEKGVYYGYGLGDLDETQGLQALFNTIKNEPFTPDGLADMFLMAQNLLEPVPA